MLLKILIFILSQYRHFSFIDCKVIKRRQAIYTLVQVCLMRSQLHLCLSFTILGNSCFTLHSKSSANFCNDDAMIVADAELNAVTTMVDADKKS